LKKALPVKKNGRHMGMGLYIVKSNGEA